MHRAKPNTHLANLKAAPHDRQLLAALRPIVGSWEAASDGAVREA